MSCQSIKMADGTVILANVKPGETLTEEDKRILAEYVEFCRERRRKKVAKHSRSRRYFMRRTANDAGVWDTRNHQCCPSTFDRSGEVVPRPRIES
jgi:hypothetical protein